MRRILIIAGASAVGKTSIAMRLLQENKEFSFIRSATTRAPRNDGHDDEYIYVSREEFLKSIESLAVIEYMEYGGNYYGTPKSEIERAFSENKTPLLILDLNGVKSLYAKTFDFNISAFYIYEDIKTIEKRLYEREIGENPTIEGLESFEKRKNANVRDFMALPDIAELFDAFIKNDDLNSAVKEIKRLFSSENKKNTEENMRIAKELSDSVK